MKSAASVIDPSILPEQARQELDDFYRFLVGKYVKRRVQHAAPTRPGQGTAGALAASPIVGIWKDRNLDDSTSFARSLREKTQHRNLS